MLKTRVVQVLESTATGTLSMVASLANLLIDNGHEVTVIYSKREETPEWLADYFRKEVKLIHLNMNPRSNVPLNTYKLRQLIKKINPDVVHLHSSIAGFIGRVAVIGLRNLRVYYSPHCISFMMKNIPNYKKRGYIWLERVANKLSGEYVACSESERAVIADNIKSATVHKIDNAVESDQTHIKRAEIFSSNTVKIITVGQIRLQKNPTLFAAIARRIIAQYPHVEFIWAGDGEGNEKQMLLDAGVQITGWKTKEEIMSLLSDSDLYLSTSDWEGLPVSVLEAMQVGLPLIVSNCYGNIDLVQSRINGLIFDGEDEAVQVIGQCLESKAFCMQLSENSIKLAEEQFSISTFKQKFLDLYQQPA